MERTTLGTVAVAALLVLALSMAAATLSDTRASEDGGGGGRNLLSSGEGSGPNGTVTRTPATPRATPTPSGESGLDVQSICFSLLANPLVLGTLLAVTVGILYWHARRFEPVVALALVLTWGFPFWFFYAGFATCDRREGSPFPSTDLPRAPNASGGGAAPGTEAVATTPEVPPAVVLLLVAAAVVVGVLLVRLDDGDPGLELPEEPTDEQRVAAVGRAAGRAADRIEGSVDADNGVYRAWVEMTDHLDVDDPASATPGEFADAAVEVGMDPGDVAELTEVFEQVRYGGRDATPDREERAVAALRRIEDAYAESPGGVARNGWTAADDETTDQGGERR